MAVAVFTAMLDSQDDSHGNDAHGNDAHGYDVHGNVHGVTMMPMAVAVVVAVAVPTTMLTMMSMEGCQVVVF